MKHSADVIRASNLLTTCGDSWMGVF